MKLVHIFLIISTFSRIQSDFSTEEVKPLKECCHVPEYIDRKVEKDCMKKCKGEDDECVIECYVETTNIVVNNVPNKIVIKNILLRENLIFFNNRLYFDDIDSAIQKCDKSFTGNSLNEKLSGFFGCVSEFNYQNCKYPFDTPECRLAVVASKFNCSAKITWDFCCEDDPLGNQEKSDCQLTFDGKSLGTWVMSRAF